MVTKVQSWGNSQGLRLSKQILEDASVSVGDGVDVAVRDGIIVVTPSRGRGGNRPCKLITRSQRLPGGRNRLGQAGRPGGLVMRSDVPNKGDYIAVTFVPPVRRGTRAEGPPSGPRREQ